MKNNVTQNKNVFIEIEETEKETAVAHKIE